MSDNPEDYELVHYGVKGMKWGRRRADKQIAKSEKKAAREKEDTGIHEARIRQVGRANKVDEQHNKAIAAFVTGDRAKSERIMAQAQKMEMDALSHPDQAMATKLTSGERRVRRGNNLAMAAIMAASVGIAVKSATR